MPSFNIMNIFNRKKTLKKKEVRLSSVFDHFSSMGSAGYSSLYNTRALYETLGFPWKIQTSEYFERFKRQDVATRIVKAPVNGTWRYDPTIKETDKDETQFELDMISIARKTRLYHYLSKLDMLALLGEYSVLYLGFMDNTDPAIPATNAKGLAFVTPIRQDNAAILDWDFDINSPRYGMPKSYNISTNNDEGSTGINAASPGSIPKTVDWTRIIHLAENTVDSDVYGIPYLQPIFNRLIGLDKLAGGSPEMYWQCARPTYLASADGMDNISDEDLIQDLKNQITEVANGQKRWMYTEGINVSTLAPDVLSPMDHVTVQLKLISAATRIPLRFLTGSERGELSSSQDERGWLSYMEERRVQVAEKLILRPLIDRLIEVNAITTPKEPDYFIEWEPLISMTEKEKAEVTLTQMQALKARSETIGGDEVFPDEYFLKQLGKSPDEIEHQLAVAKEAIANEDRDMEIEVEVEEDINNEEKEESGG